MFTMLVFIFACTIFTVEILGEVDGFDYYANPAWISVHDALPMTLTEAVYFTMITVSTVGYGDFSPATVVGRLLVMLFILCVCPTVLAHSALPTLHVEASQAGRQARQGRHGG